ncbi:ABC transporter permease [Sphingomonas ginkgonis]|uniref:ABC transporter permease n=1 Tax=Sphingomonas ginkgonis TaxID=2315330 RepID=UPI00163A3846|nr:ABC transporter permease [Sphingomonas ginkgonis]
MLRRPLEVTYLLVLRDFRGRYKHTRVGMLWSVINPLLFLFIFYFVFSEVLAVKTPRYASFAFVGILSWSWLQNSLTSAASSISGNPGLVSQPGFPVGTLPVVSTSTALLNLLLSAPVLAAILLFEGARPGLALAALPLVLAINFVLILGLAYLVAAVNVAFRDVEHILPIILQLGYYVTPIFYSTDRIPARYHWVFQFNPMAHMIEAYRDILLDDRWPAPGSLLGAGIAGALLLGAGIAYFRRARFRFLEEI